MLVMGRICNANFIRLVTSGMTSQEGWMFATGKLGNKSNKIFCDLTGYMINISGYKQTLVRFHLRSYENEKRYFYLCFSDPILAVNLEG